MIKGERGESRTESQSYPAVVDLGVEAGPLVLQHTQVLLGLGGTWSCLLSSAGQQHGLSLVQQAVVLLCSLRQLGLKVLHTDDTTQDLRLKAVGREQRELFRFDSHFIPDVSV